MVPLGWVALGGLPTVMMVTVPSVWLETDRTSFSPILQQLTQTQTKHGLAGGKC
jgi:hypothetical protein